MKCVEKEPVKVVKKETVKVVKKETVEPEEMVQDIFGLAFLYFILFFTER